MSFHSLCAYPSCGDSIYSEYAFSRRESYSLASGQLDVSTAVTDCDVTVLFRFLNHDSLLLLTVSDAVRRRTSHCAQKMTLTNA